MLRCHLPAPCSWYLSPPSPHTTPPTPPIHQHWAATNHTRACDSAPIDPSSFGKNPATVKLQGIPTVIPPTSAGEFSCLFSQTPLEDFSFSLVKSLDKMISRRSHIPVGRFPQRSFLTQRLCSKALKAPL